MADRKPHCGSFQSELLGVRTGYPVVGIGASAGGFEALKALLKNLPTKPGLALVLVPHLDSNADSRFSVLLTRISPMPVHTITDGMVVAPDHLYVSPPNTSLQIAKGRLRLRSSKRPARLPIDKFLESLAKECGQRAIGVILSGNVADGVRGLQAIKTAGGVTLAQDFKSAKHDSMPRAAVAAGCVDRVLSPAKIAGELVRLAQRPEMNLGTGAVAAKGQIAKLRAELHTTNEEIQLSNEELQLVNADLRAAKDELQIANEELRNRNQTLGQLSNEITNLLTSTQIPIVMIDAERRIRRFTPVAETILNLTPADVGRSISAVDLGMSGPGLDQLITAALLTLSVQERDVQDRQSRWYTLRVRPYLTADHKIDGVVIAWLDVDTLKRNLAMIVESRDLAESVIETVSEPLLVLASDLRIDIANRAFFEKFHVTKSETIGRRIYELGARELDLPGLRKLLEGTVTTSAEFHDYAVKIKVANLGHRDLLLGARRLMRTDRATPLIVLSIADITEQKQAARAEFSDHAIVGVNLGGEVTSWNKGAERLFEVTADAALGQPVAALIAQELADNLPRVMEQLRQRQSGLKYDVVHHHQDGRVLNLAVMVSPVRAAGGAVSGLSVVLRDITAHRHAEAQVQAALAEKDVLLREVHCRVKNNLQLIVSLLNLQVDKLAEDPLRPVFGNVRDRVFAMALVHDQLYRAGNLAQLDFAEYAGSLLRYLWRNHHGAARVQLELAVVPVQLPVDAAVVCGLILHELVSNAIHHAFPDDRSGTLLVELKYERATDRITLLVRDNGVGLPADLDWQQSPSLGLHLVQLLAGQLHGTLEAGTGPGTEFRLTFSTPEKQA